MVRSHRDMQLLEEKGSEVLSYPVRKLVPSSCMWVLEAIYDYSSANTTCAVM